MGVRRKQPAIEWDTLTQPEFDRLIEALVQREYPAGVDVRPIDGRGGDDGIDIDATHSDGRRDIYQLKFFLEGFSGKHKDRRRQIRESFDRAMTHLPNEWILVMPCSLTPSDWLFIKKLRTEQPDATVTVWDRSKLDAKLSQRPDLVDVMQRDEYTLATARIAGLEKAVLLGGSEDLAERVALLGATVDGVDPDWTVDFQRRGDLVINTLRAKHPRAAETSPITIRFRTEFDETQGPLQASLHRALAYGLGTDITLPVDVVKDFAVDGPALVQRDAQDGVELSLIRAPNADLIGKSIEILLTSTDGSTLGSHYGTTTDGSSGTLGFSFRASFYDVVTLSFLVPIELQEPVTIEYVWNGGGSRSAADLRRAAQLTLDMAASTGIDISIEGQHAMRACSAPGATLHAGGNLIAEVRVLHGLMVDLDEVQRHINNYFPVPLEVSALERILLRSVRLMLDGECVMHPQLSGIGVTVSASTDLSVPTHQALFSDEGSQVLVQIDPMPFDFAGRTIQLPTTNLWHPCTRLQEPERVRAELATGRDVDCRVDAVDGSHLRMFMPDRIPGGQSLEPVPWGLDGITEVLPPPAGVAT